MPSAARRSRRMASSIILRRHGIALTQAQQLDGPPVANRVVRAWPDRRELLVELDVLGQRRW